MRQQQVVASRAVQAGRSVVSWTRNLSRRNLVLIALALVAGGLAFNSGGLAAAGIPPLLIGVLPCIAMCALGLCKKGDGSGSSCSKPGGAENSSNTLERN